MFYANRVSGSGLRGVWVSGPAWAKPTRRLPEGLAGTGSQRLVSAPQTRNSKGWSCAATLVQDRGGTERSAVRSGGYRRTGVDPGRAGGPDANLERTDDRGTSAGRRAVGRKAGPLSDQFRTRLAGWVRFCRTSIATGRSGSLDWLG